MRNRVGLQCYDARIFKNMSATIDYSLIDLQTDPDTEEWWAATKEHRLLVPTCGNCNYRWFPPSPVCPHCRSTKLGWYEAEGTGVIASYVVVEHPVLAAFRETVPYTVVLVELSDCANFDGVPVRIGGVLIDNELTGGIGAAVEVHYDHAPDDTFVVPRWSVTATSEDVWCLED